MGQFKLLVEFAVKPGRLDDFRAASQKLIEITQTEPGTLGYDWYISADDSRVRIVEVFADSAAYVTHSANIAPVVAEIVDAGTLEHSTVLGDVDAEAQAALMGPSTDFYGYFGGIER